MTTPATEQHPSAEHRDPDTAHLLAVHADAADYYTARLREPAGVPQRRYLADRGLASCWPDPRWQVGYAPAGWTHLTRHLQQLGYSDQTLIDSGLVIPTRSGGGLVDRFRDRITLGIRNEGGDTVGFIARAAPGAAPTVPKYLNSPNTDLYTKHRLLFGLAEQQKALVEGATPVIVEGPLDVLAVDAASDGRWAAVAPCGTALTAEQVTELAQHTDSRRVIVAFDPDPAGLKAAAAAYPILTGHFSSLVAPTLGADPADTVTNGGTDTLARALLTTRPLAEGIIDAKLAPWRGELDNAEAKIAALRSTAKTIADLGLEAPARHVGRLADTLDLPTQTITRELTAAVTTHHQRGARSMVDPAPAVSASVEECRRSAVPSTSRSSLAQARTRRCTP